LKPNTFKDPGILAGFCIGALSPAIDGRRETAVRLDALYVLMGVHPNPALRLLVFLIHQIRQRLPSSIDSRGCRRFKVARIVVGNEDKLARTVDADVICRAVSRTRLTVVV
jgi:hypothetical protein